ncbi:hypothetical protein IPM09_02320 [Candidatus Saccharibacteria bacterium]|nr:MAG: hypothetical protein IPM09_02320 [Candidatus Saccharibacteria bacterium]
MGVIYSTEAVSRGHLPKPGAHSEAASELLAALFGADQHPSLLAGMIYGSVALGNENLRSDIDVFVLYDAAAAVEALATVSRCVREVSGQHHTVFEVHASPHHRNYAQIDDYAIDDMIGSHLRSIAEHNNRWVRGDIASYLASPPMGSEAIIAGARHAIAHKSFKFAKALCSEFDLASLQRAYEFPSTVGRRALDIISLVDNSYRVDRGWRSHLQAATRSYLADTIGDTALVESHDALVSGNNRYTTLLERAIAGDVSENEYDSELRGHYVPAMNNALNLANGWQYIINRLVAREFSYSAKDA